MSKSSDGEAGVVAGFPAACHPVESRPRFALFAFITSGADVAPRAGRGDVHGRWAGFAPFTVRAGQWRDAAHLGMVFDLAGVFGSGRSAFRVPAQLGANRW